MCRIRPHKMASHPAGLQRDSTGWDHLVLRDSAVGGECSGAFAMAFIRTEKISSPVVSHEILKSRSPPSVASNRSLDQLPHTLFA